MKIFLRELFSYSGLKVIAVFAMVIDHVAVYLLSEDSMPYLLMRAIGRVSFPVFAMLIGQGYQHSHDRLRYGLSLFLFALLSEAPWQLLNADGSHNVMFTLLAGYLGICIIGYLKDRYMDGTPWYGLVPEFGTGCVLLFSLGVGCWYYSTDFSYYGYLLIISLHVLRNHPLFKVEIGFLLMIRELWPGQLLSFFLVYHYNGKRGFLRGGWAKYLFYMFYPVHLLVIWIIRSLLV